MFCLEKKWTTGLYFVDLGIILDHYPYLYKG